MFDSFARLHFIVRIADDSLLAFEIVWFTEFIAIIVWQTNFFLWNYIFYGLFFMFYFYVYRLIVAMIEMLILRLFSEYLIGRNGITNSCDEYYLEYPLFPRYFNDRNFLHWNSVGKADTLNGRGQFSIFFCIEKKYRQLFSTSPAGGRIC